MDLILPGPSLWIFQLLALIFLISVLVLIVYVCYKILKKLDILVVVPFTIFALVLSQIL